MLVGYFLEAASFETDWINQTTECLFGKVETPKDLGRLSEISIPSLVLHPPSALSSQVSRDALRWCWAHYARPILFRKVQRAVVWLKTKKRVKFKDGLKPRRNFEMLEMFHQHLKERERDIGCKFVFLTTFELIPLVSLGYLEVCDELVNSGR